MSLSTEKQLAIDVAATQGNWDQDRIEAATRHADLTEAGQEQLAHVEQEQQRADVELQKGLGLTAAKSLEIDAAAARGDWDQERIDRAREAAMSAQR